MQGLQILILARSVRGLGRVHGTQETRDVVCQLPRNVYTGGLGRWRSAEFCKRCCVKEVPELLLNQCALKVRQYGTAHHRHSLESEMRRLSERRVKVEEENEESEVLSIEELCNSVSTDPLLTQMRRFSATEVMQQLVVIQAAHLIQSPFESNRRILERLSCASHSVMRTFLQEIGIVADDK